jgi:hypothetical protein
MEENSMIGMQSAQPTFTYRTSRPPEFHTAVVFESTPWLMPTIRQLEQLEQSGQDLPGIGDFRLSQDTVRMVRILLSRIPIANLPQPKLIPISGGAVSLVWTFASGDVDFTVYPNEGYFAYVLTDEKDATVGDGIMGLDEQDRIGTILRSRAH